MLLTAVYAWTSQGKAKKTALDSSNITATTVTTNIFGFSLLERGCTNLSLFTAENAWMLIPKALKTVQTLFNIVVTAGPINNLICLKNIGQHSQFLIIANLSTGTRSPF